LATNVFISYNFKDEETASIISYLLRQQPELDPFLYADERRTDEWPKLLIEKLSICHAFVYLAGKVLGETQEREVNWHFKDGVEAGQKTLVVCLPGCTIPKHFAIQGNFRPLPDPKASLPILDDPIAEIARQIALRLTGHWVPSDGVPLGYLFDYEKEIIKAYKNKRLSAENGLAPKLLESGCPPNWPEIVRRDADRELHESFQSTIGAFRDPSDGIAVDTRTAYGTGPGDHTATNPLTFPEAGPRQLHRYPLQGEVSLRVGVLVSGGIAPGINAVIDGIVKRHELYHSAAIKAELYHQKGGSGFYRKEYTLTILGYREGLQSLSNAGEREPFILTKEVVNRQAEMGGALLSTARWDEFMEANAIKRDELLTNMVGYLDNVDILYVIGGDGSMRAAHSLWKKAHDLGPRRRRRGQLSVVGIPKTMDNDILWVWQSFGFLSAVEKAREVVLNLHTEAKSNPRLCILQLFGSDSGFVANHAGLASGVCDAVLIPEVDYTMEGLFDHLEKQLNERYEKSAHGLVVMAETAIPLDAREYIAPKGKRPDEKGDLLVELSDDEVGQIHAFFNHGRRVRGQTPDHLRTGGLKIVSGVLQKMIKQRLQPRAYWEKFRVFTSEPRHLIRSVPPSSSDVIFAERLGTLAVDNAMAGYTDFMVSQWLTEFVLVPLDLVILGRKRVPPNGIFWKSVLASTGQPEDMKTSKRKPR